MANGNGPAPDRSDLPGLAKTDWDALADDTAVIDPDEAETAAGPADIEEEEGLEEIDEDDDDNTYQESDEALPDDEEEAAIARDPGREGKFRDV